MMFFPVVNLLNKDIVMRKLGKVSLMALSVFLFFLGTVLAQTEPSAEARKALSDGQSILEGASSSEAYHAAIRKFEEARKLSPDAAEVFYYMGVAQAGIGRYSDAIQSLSTYLEKNSSASDEGEVKILIEKYKGLQASSNQAIVGADQGGAAGQTAEEGDQLIHAMRYEDAARVYAAVVASNPSDYRSFYNMGICYMNLGKINPAIEVFQKAIELNPRYGLAYTDLGAAYNRLGRYSDAEAALAKAVALSPDYPLAYFDSGMALTYQGRHAEAIPFYLKAIEKKSDYKEAYNNLAASYSEIGKTEEAIKAYRKALSIDPNYPSAAQGLGTLLSQSSHHASEGIAKLKRAFEKSPNNAALAFKVGLAYFNEKNYDGAVEWYRKAIAVNDSYGDAWYNLGVVYRESNRPAESIPCFVRAVQINPNDASGYINLGASFLDVNKSDEAIPQLQRALQLDPQSAVADMNMGNALAAQKQYTQAIFYYEAAAKINAQDPEPYYQMGYMMMGQNENEKAIGYFLKVVELNPQYQGALHNLGLCYNNLHQNRRAEEYYNKAIKVSPDEAAESYFALGLLQQEEGNQSLAKDNFSKAAKSFMRLLKDSQDPELYNRASGAWFKLGNNAKALELLKESIRLKSDYADAWVGLGMCHAALGNTDQARQDLIKGRDLHRQQGNMAGIEEAEEDLRNLK